MDKKEFEIEINRFNDVSFYNEADFDILLIKLKDLAEKDILTKNYVFRGINKVEEFFPKIIRRKMGLVEDNC